MKRWPVFALALMSIACGKSDSHDLLPTPPSDASGLTSCAATWVIPTQGEEVGQDIQLEVRFPAGCTGVDALVASIDGQRCDQAPYPFPNPGCSVSGDQFSTSTWVQITPGTHTLSAQSWVGPTESQSNSISFTYTPSTPPACAATILIPSENERVGQAIQLKVSFAAGCTPDAMTAYIDGQRCDQAPYPSPNPGCSVSGDEFSPSTWVQVTPGTHTLVVESTEGSAVLSSAPVTFTYNPSSGHDPVLAGAGDIGWYAGKTFEVATGNELRKIAPDYVFTLGDNAYGSNGNDQGAIENYDALYDPAWGPLKTKTLPMPGNHDYGNWDSQPDGQARVMSGYYAYFTGADANSPAKAVTVGGTSWDAFHYAVDILTASGKKWRYVSVNSGDCFYQPYRLQNCGPNSSEYAWLKQELAGDVKASAGGDYVGIIVGTHFDRWESSGCGHGNSQVQPFLELMQQYHVDLYLAGHVHNYERFCQIGSTPQETTQGNCASAEGPVCDPSGPVELNVGTGGADDGSTAMPDAWAASQTRISKTGVLKLMLHDTSWSFEFLGTSNTVLDSGSYAVH
jgi:hypothetical protein